MTTLVERDRGLLWHPYAALDDGARYAVRGATGVRLELETPTGERVTTIDAMSSWWCAIHGYRHPVLDAAVHEQVDRFSHVMFGGLTHEPAVRLAEDLVRITPEPLRHVFLADSGSVAIEVALKLALQVQQAAGRLGRRRFVALRGGYHGDTTGAMSVCDPVDGMHATFRGLVAEQVFLPRPPAPDADPAAWIAVAEKVIEAHADTLAGIIVEPLLQGAGGMYRYHPDCLVALRRLADRHRIVLIADEIATGFGRTGTMFAVDRAGIVPDVMCVGKALTGGYLTLAAVMCTGEVADAISGSVEGALLHGPTFMANPLACAVASASLGLLADSLDAVARIERDLTTALAPAAALESVTEVRVMGAVGVVQLRDPVDVGAVTRVAVGQGVWVRPFRDLVYTMPPYRCEPDDVAAIGHAITTAVARVHG